MLYVVLRCSLSIKLLNVIYKFKCGDVVKLDVKEGLALHEKCCYLFDLDKTEYYVIH